MQLTSNIRRMCVLAGLIAIGATATAASIPYDAQIKIDRALNSPTLTIRYEGANAAIVELRINGESMGTRSVNAAKASGETNFTINLSLLKDGDNKVEVMLYDRTGKLVATDTTNISTDQSNSGPVFLKTPKVGQTVQGAVEINMGFGKEMKNVYVSFFVDNDFKKMSNYPPYTFVWDTTLERNGWHEVEAWVIDESSTTYKTRKTRVFINNPGGRTDRVGVESGAKVATNPVKGEVTGTEAGFKTGKVDTSGKTINNATGGVTPGTDGKLSTNPVKANPGGGMSGAKPAVDAAVLATSAKSITPNTVAVNQQTGGVTQSVQQVASATNTIKIAKGQRIPNLGTFAVVLNSQFVNFDVNPRVDDGVPMTPFRHLLEKAGGTVDWENVSKTLKAKADGKAIYVQIGDKIARIDGLSVTLERTPYLERGRTIVPLSFLNDVLNVDIEFDKETGHVLITSLKK